MYRRRVADYSGYGDAKDLGEEERSGGVQGSRQLTLDARCRSSVMGTVGDGVDGARRPSV